MSLVSQLDAHRKPPEQLRKLFKKYRRSNAEDLLGDPGVIDMHHSAHKYGDRLRLTPEVSIDDRTRAFEDFLSSDFGEGIGKITPLAPAFEVTRIPGQLV
jgi:hypothetical protein